MKLRLTGRDRAILTGVHEYGILSSEQVRKLYFADVDRSTALRRLRKLKAKKYVVALTGLEYGKQAFVLGKNGEKFLAVENALKTINRNTLEHDVLVSELRILFDSHKLGSNWLSGHVLRQQMGINKNSYQRHETVIPDWLLSLRFIDRSLTTALELELHLKSRTRIRKVLESYRKKKRINFILYVVPSKSFGRRLLEEVKQVCPEQDEHWLGYCLLGEALSDFKNLKVHFPNKSVPLLGG